MRIRTSEIQKRMINKKDDLKGSCNLSESMILDHSRLFTNLKAWWTYNKVESINCTFD